LEAIMQDTATHPKPILMNRLPLAARPQDIPNSIQHRSVISTRSTRLTLFGGARKQFLDLLPQRGWHLKVIDILELFSMLGRHGVPRLVAYWKTPFLRVTPLFSRLNRIYG
jgi:hypothetical protein